MKPALELGIEYLMKNSYLESHFNFSVIYADSGCSIADAMNQAIKLYMKTSINVFFGPVCNYALAPIARQIKYWNIPLISVGAMAWDFSHNRDKMYTLLTRVGPSNLNFLPAFTAHAMRYYKWKSVKLLYEEKSFEFISIKFCRMVTESLYYEMKDTFEDINTDYYKLDNKSFPKTLRDEIGNKYAGK